MFCSIAHLVWEESFVDWWVSLCSVCNHTELATGNPCGSLFQDRDPQNPVCILTLVHTCFSHATYLPQLLGGLYAANVKLQLDGRRKVLCGLGFDFVQNSHHVLPYCKALIDTRCPSSLIATRKCNVSKSNLFFFFPRVSFFQAY